MGIRIFLDKLKNMYHLDDQDQAWTSIDRFFSFKQSTSMDFQTYVFEWQHLYDEAEKLGGLQLSEPAICWLFWSRTSFSDKIIADLRLTVRGDLTKWQEMITLQLKICKHEYASQEQARYYRHTYNSNIDGLSGNQAIEAIDDSYRRALRAFCTPDRSRGIEATPRESNVQVR